MHSNTWLVSYLRWKNGVRRSTISLVVNWYIVDGQTTSGEPVEMAKGLKLLEYMVYFRPQIVQDFVYQQ